jgi:hypothetical protein
MMRKEKHERAGLSLVEVMAMMAGLSLVLAFSASLLAGAYKIEAAAGEAFRRQNCWSSLADQFRADVSGARDAPDRREGLAAGPTCLILGKADGVTIVYSVNDGRLERSETAMEGNESRRIIPLGWEHGSVRFARAQPDGMVRLQVLPPADSGPPGRYLEIAASLGGDLR